jgi:hypothetical protein
VDDVDRTSVPTKRWARRVLEVHRDPTSSADAPYGWRFGTQLRLGTTDAVTPLAAPEARIPVADLPP